MSEKRFCIAGPIIPSIHYFIPRRLDWQKIDQLIEGMNYFVLHAPRQSGKTTAIEEYINHMNTHGTYKVLYLNIEDAQAARDNIAEALLAIVSILKDSIQEKFPEDIAVI